MDSQLTILMLVIAYFGWMLWAGWKTHRGRNKNELEENFLIGNRNVSAPLVAIGITMGWVDAFQFAFTPALTFDQGLFGLSYGVVAPVCFILMGLFAGKIRDHAAKTRAYMMGNYFSETYSPRCAALVGGCMFIYMFTWLIIQLVFGSQVLVTITGISPTTAILGMGLVTLAYMMMGGFLASIRTDLIQFFIFLVFAAVILFNITPSAPHWLMSPPIAPLSWEAALSIMVVAGISTLIAPDVWQRIYSARSATEAKRSMFLTAGLMLPMLAFFGVLGLVVHQVNGAPDSNHVISGIFQSVVPQAIMPLAIVAFMAAIMSTMATSLFGGSMNIASDILLELKIITRQGLEKTTRWLMLGLLLAAMLISQLPFDILSIGMICMSAVLPVFPLTVAMVLGYNVSEPAAFYSLLISLVAYFIGAYFNIYTGACALAPLAIATVTLLAFQFAQRKRP